MLLVVVRRVSSLGPRVRRVSSRLQLRNLQCDGMGWQRMIVDDLMQGGSFSFDRRPSKEGLYSRLVALRNDCIVIDVHRIENSRPRPRRLVRLQQ